MLKFEVPLMFVKDYNNEFVKRQGSLQDALAAAEKECGKNIPLKLANKSGTKSTSKQRKCRSATKHFRGKESMFKVPDSPPRRRVNFGTLFKTNKVRSGKWIKYTLSDVSEDDMSEITNARTAFSFMKELENRKKGGNNDGPPVSLDNFKPVFKKPTVKREPKVTSIVTKQDRKEDVVETKIDSLQSTAKLSFYGNEDE